MWRSRRDAAPGLCSWGCVGLRSELSKFELMGFSGSHGISVGSLGQYYGESEPPPSTLSSGQRPTLISLQPTLSPTSSSAISPCPTPRTARGSRSLAGPTTRIRSRAAGLATSRTSPSRTLPTTVSELESSVIASNRDPLRIIDGPVSCGAMDCKEDRGLTRDRADVDNPIYLTQCYSSSTQQCQQFPATRKWTASPSFSPAKPLVPTADTPFFALLAPLPHRSPSYLLLGSDPLILDSIPVIAIPSAASPLTSPSPNLRSPLHRRHRHRLRPRRQRHCRDPRVFRRMLQHHSHGHPPDAQERHGEVSLR
jgi:hypothetical protein